VILDCTMVGTARFIVRVHRSAESIFGAASHPVNRNGILLTFDDENRAREECARLNARLGNSVVRYSVERETEAIGRNEVLAVKIAAVLED
jgi:hypothetical protein